MMINKRYSVSLEICHLKTKEEAEKLADKIKHRLRGLNCDVYLCVGSYEQLESRSGCSIVRCRLKIDLTFVGKVGDVVLAYLLPGGSFCPIEVTDDGAIPMPCEPDIAPWDAEIVEENVFYESPNEPEEKVEN